MNAEIQTLKTRLEQLEQDNVEIRQENAEIKMQFRNERRRLRVQMSLALASVIGAIFLSPANRSALAQGYGTGLKELLLRVKALEGKTQFMNADSVAKSTTFSGCNVIVNNGLGATNGYPTDPYSDDSSQTQTNGLGNLIIGYNETRGPNDTDIRTGSHNLILGVQQNYSSFAGVIAGDYNTISGPYASVSGGYFCTASGRFAFVSGGYFNIASGTGSSISGGGVTRATGLGSSISGGAFILEKDDFGWSGGSYHSP